MALLSVSFYQIMLLITVLNIARAPCVLHCFRCTFLEEQHAEPTPANVEHKLCKEGLEMLRLPIYIGAAGGFSLQIGVACFVL